MEQLDKFKTDKLLELRVNFSHLINFINTLPLNQNFKTFAFQNLDQGCFWVEKGLEFLQAEEQPKKEDKKEEDKPQVDLPPESNIET